ncbi:MAG: MFS transporter [Fibrobacterota bacterium]
MAVESKVQQGPGMFRALKSRNYRLFFAGQGISLIGTFLQQVALGWYVYGATGSKMLLGTLAFTSQIPSLVCAPFAGALADRWDRKKALIAIQSLSGLQALVLAVLVATDRAPIWSLLLLSGVLGALNAFDIPFRQAFVSQMIDDKSVLANAIALNSALFNGARLVGPSVGGLLVAAVGEGTCFFLNAASYLAVVAALVAIRPIPVVSVPRQKLYNEILEGVGYVARHRPIRDLLLLVSAVGLLGLAYLVLLPVVARDLLHGDAKTLGLLMAAGGAGSLVAALTLAARKSVRGLMSRIAVAALVSGAGVMALAFATQLWVCMGFIALTGFGFVTCAGGANAVIQTLVDDRYRGRVMSLYTLAFLGTSTFGSLGAGWLADGMGVPYSMTVYGTLFLCCATVFTVRLPGLRADVREKYAKIGVIP